MSLLEKITAQKEQFLASAPADKVALMGKATQELSDSGILSRILPVGGKLPDFSLVDSAGKAVSTADLLQGGTVVLTFYRGIW